MHSYLLGNEADIAFLQVLRELTGTMNAQGTWVLRNGKIIKSGSFDTVCAPWDTTIVSIDL
ncbi:MAG: hypothetical protein ACK5Q2_08245 [Bacteroidota bacterium]|jgi:hypothetical protein